jgi:hypothetical protein
VKCQDYDVALGVEWDAGLDELKTAYLMVQSQAWLFKQTPFVACSLAMPHCACLLHAGEFHVFCKRS